MSTDQTPALARATEALVDTYLDGVKGDEDEHYRMGSIGARAAVSAALHDPDDDVIARTLREHGIYSPRTLTCRCGADVATGPTRLGTWNHFAHMADAVRAAILGSDRG